MERVRRKLASDMPELTTYFQAGGLVDSVINRACRRPSIFRSAAMIWTSLSQSPAR